MTVESYASEINYVADADGKPVSVIVPINLWEEIQQEIRSENETAYLLSSETMKKRLLAAKDRTGGFTMDEVCSVCH